MSDVSQRIPELHRAYCEALGVSIRLDFERERQWYEWIQRGINDDRPEGFTVGDLLLVIGHIRRGIRERKRNEGALKFRNLIGQPDYFEEDLAEARSHASARAKASPSISAGRAAALRATGRPTEPKEKPVVHAGAVSQKALDHLRQFRQQLQGGTETPTKPTIKPDPKTSFTD